MKMSLCKTVNLRTLQQRVPGPRKSAGTPAESGAKMTVIPNPAHNAARVQYAVENPEGFEQGTLKLFSLSGRLVESKTVNQPRGQARFDLSNQAAGTYIVVFFNRGRRTGQRSLIRE